jgi:periplasmic copper chaperone A
VRPTTSHWISRRVLLCSIATLLLPTVAFVASAATLAQRPLASDAWARATPPGVQTGAAYLTVTGGSENDRLVRVESEVAASVEMHRVIEVDGTVQMRPVETVEVAADSNVVFAPGGLHLMLVNLTHPLIAGSHFELTLIFEKAGRVQVDVEVRPVG